MKMKNLFLSMLFLLVFASISDAGVFRNRTVIRSKSASACATVPQATAPKAAATATVKTRTRTRLFSRSGC